MNIHIEGKIEVHFGQYAAVLRKLDEVLAQGVKIMATQADLVKQLNDVQAELVKIGTETQTSLTLIQSLQDIIANGPAVTPELQAAVDAVAAQAKVVDDLVPDVVTKK